MLGFTLVFSCNINRNYPLKSIPLLYIAFIAARSVGEITPNNSTNSISDIQTLPLGIFTLPFSLIVIIARSIVTFPELLEGGVSLQDGQSANNENVFFIGPNDWLYQSDDHLWNSGTESNPLKTEYDPCPEGWRVPTYAELDELNNHFSSWTKDNNGQRGRWFSGPYSYTASVPQVFFPAAGYRNYYDGSAYNRGYNGNYWSSRPDSFLYFYSSNVNMYDYYYRADGYSVRCVQD